MDADVNVFEVAEREGFDLSLLESNLALSYEERVLRHEGALELVLMMREAGRALYAQTPPDSATPR